MFSTADIIYFVIAIISFILSLFLLRNKDLPIYLKSFAPFIFIDTAISFLTTYLAYQSINTISIANILSTAEFCFYIWVIRCIIHNVLIKKISLLLIIIYPFLVFVNLAFIQGFNNFHSITYSISCLFIVFLSVYYFFELFQAQYSVQLVKEPAFWICTSLLFYYCVSFPLYVLINFMKNFPPNLGNLIGLITSILNIILFSLFSIAFLCKIQIRKSSLL